jgi:hypothetical protein
LPWTPETPLSPLHLACHTSHGVFSCPAPWPEWWKGAQPKHPFRVTTQSSPLSWSMHMSTLALSLSLSFPTLGLIPYHVNWRAVPCLSTVAFFIRVGDESDGKHLTKQFTFTETNISQFYIWHHCMFYMFLLPTPLTSFQVTVHVIDLCPSNQFEWKTL